MKRFVFFLTLIISCSCFAQTDSISIGKKITDYKPSKSELIAKGRQMLLDEFYAGNMGIVTKVIDYFDKEINDKYTVALWPAERLLLYYWAGEYEKIIDFNAYQVNELSESRTQLIIRPADHAVYYEVAAASVEHYNELLDDIEQAEFSDEAQDFLVLLLDRILSMDHPDFISREKLNDNADKFIADYPYSPMTDIVKQYVLDRWEIGDWVFGVNFGGGYTFTSGNMTDYFRPQANICMSADVYYKRSAFYFMIQGGFGDLHKDIRINDVDVWEKGTPSDVTSIGLCLGYSIFDNARLRITPFAGVSFGFAEPTTSNDDEDVEPYLKDFSIGTSVSQMFGLNVTYRFKDPTKPEDHYYSMGSWGMNLRVSYIPSILRHEGNQYAGDVIFLSLGVNIDAFNLKKKK